MRIIAIRSRRNIKSNKKQKIIDNNKGVSCDTSFLVGWCVKERKSCGADTEIGSCRIKFVSSSSKHLANSTDQAFCTNYLQDTSQANISHEYLGENLIILFAQPHFRNLLFRILNEDFIV